MSDRTFVLIHLAGEDRLLSTLAENLPSCGMTTRDNPQFMYQGETYEVFSVLDHFGDTHSFSTGQRLFAVLTKMTGSEERAAALLEAVEPMFGSPSAAVTVTRGSDGSISVDVPSNAYYGLTLVRAGSAMDNSFMRQLGVSADKLIAKKAAASAAAESSPGAATTGSAVITVDADELDAAPICAK